MKIYEVKYFTFPTDKKDWLGRYCPAQVTNHYVAYIETDNISEIDGILKEYYKEPIDEIFYSSTITAIEVKENIILIKK